MFYQWKNMPKSRKRQLPHFMLHPIASLKAQVEAKRPQNFPKVICLCGSTRFTAEMLVKQWELTKQGNVVLSWCALPDNYFQGEDKTHIGDQEGVKEIVDEVHKRKIDLSDELFVINIGGYIGKSTQSEIDYGIAHGKPVKYLESLKSNQEK
jgi:hypothetical protein